MAWGAAPVTNKGGITGLDGLGGWTPVRTERRQESSRALSRPGTLVPAVQSHPPPPPRWRPWAGVSVCVAVTYGKAAAWFIDWTMLYR